MLTRNRLVTAQNSFSAAQIDDGITVFHPLDQTVDDFASAVFVFFELALALSFAHLLDDHLFRRLCSDPAKVNRRQDVDDELTRRRIRLFPQGIGQGKLRALVFNLGAVFEHFNITCQHDLAGFAVNMGTDIVLVAILGATGFLDGHFHGFQYLFTLNTFIARDGVGDGQQFRPGVNVAGFHQGFTHDAFSFPNWAIISSVTISFALAMSSI